MYGVLMYCPMTGRTINDLRNALNVPGRVTLVVHLTEGSHSYSDRNRTSLRIYYTPLLYPPLSDTEFAALLCSSETCEGPEGSQRASYGGESRVRRFIVCFLDLLITQSTVCFYPAITYSYKLSKRSIIDSELYIREEAQLLCKADKRVGSEDILVTDAPMDNRNTVFMSKEYTS